MTGPAVGRRLCVVGLAVCCVVATTGSARADEVTDWNRYMFDAARVAATSPLNMGRFAAIVQASVFDAVNGIERRYTPVHVTADAPRGASQRAAAVQAAYAALVHIYPAQTATFGALRADSLAAIASGEAVEASESIARGLEWGQAVADDIWAWRSTDGFLPNPPPYLGFNIDGKWRPTPPAFAPGVGPQFATMTPWVIATPSSFRPAGPPALGSLPYLADLHETQTMGSISSALRTPDQTFASQFWASTTANYFWNGVAVRLGAARHATLSENARLFALLNVAMADAAIACWEAKYHYVFWRPITAIRVTDPTWTPLIPTPAHPEYPSGHSTVSGAAAVVLAGFFGENTAFDIDTDGANQSAAGPGAPPLAGAARSFTSFTAALDEVKDARIFGGIHFRTACDDGQATGRQVALYIAANAFLPVHGNKTGQTQK
jgi:PAP2 superfamily